MDLPPVQPTDALQSRRADIAQVGHTLFQRRLTDAAGGNLSLLAGESTQWICMSPRYAAHRWHWSLTVEQVLVLDRDGRQRAGEGQPSRDLDVHRSIYDAVPEARAIVHAHAPNLMVYAMAKRTLRPRLAATRPLGEVEVLSPRDELDEAIQIAEAFAIRRSAVERFAAAVLLAEHGVVVAGRDLWHAYDALERLETDARTQLMARLLHMPVNASPDHAVWA